jgi:hypothetical protein
VTPAAEAPGLASALARRLTWMMLVRTVVISVVLGMALWLGRGRSIAEVTLLGLVVITYLATIAYAVLLRRGFAPTRLVWPQLLGDLAVTSALVHVTGGGPERLHLLLRP